MESVLQNINKLNRSLEGVIAVCLIDHSGGVRRRKADVLAGW